MFEVGFTELLLIFALALLVLGPQKLPKLAQQVGRWVGRARAMARQFREQLEEEAHTLETKMTIDPGIDSSLDPKKPASPPDNAASRTSTAATPSPYQGVADQNVPYQDVEEEFYPPDHHMHPSNRAVSAPDATPGAASADPQATADAPSAEPSRQGELDLTNNPEHTKAP